MKKKSVIAINLCLIASIVTLFGNKIYMLYIGDCHQLWEEAQTHYVNRQYEKARELLEKIAHIDTAPSCPISDRRYVFKRLRR